MLAIWLGPVMRRAGLRNIGLLVAEMKASEMRPDKVKIGGHRPLAKSHSQELLD